MSTVRDRIGKQAMEVKQELQKMREATQDASGEELEQSRRTVSKWCEPGPDTLLYVKHTVQQLVRKLPFKWVLIAAGAGVLLGAFWTIRRR
jgi:ElaB/YqjD/DUF883 family membrane-anchored ribosome-binding protein